MLLAWLAARGGWPGNRWFEDYFSPREGSAYDVLIKEVDWAIHAEAITSALRPELIVIFRHPCAVVASQLRGLRLGLLPPTDRGELLEYYGPSCERMGFDRQSILEMDLLELHALRWLLTNRLYREILAAYPRGYAVVYEDLCRDPIQDSAAIYDFLGWPLERQTLDFIRDSTDPVRSPIWALFQFSRPYFRIYRNPGKVESAWRTRLTAHEQACILSIVEPHFPCDELWGEDVRNARRSGGTGDAIEPTSLGSRCGP
jgi:hypothetical protein